MRNRPLMALLLGLLVMVIATGCKTGETDPFKDDFAQEKYADYVPLTAQIVTHGIGVLTFTSPADGTVYVLDNDELVDVLKTKKPKLRGQGQIDKGAEVTFDPSTGRLWPKGGNGIRMLRVDTSHTHELRFQPAADEHDFIH